MTQSIEFNGIPKEVTETWAMGPGGNAVPVVTVTLELRGMAPGEVEKLGQNLDRPVQVSVEFPIKQTG